MSQPPLAGAPGGSTATGYAAVAWQLAEGRLGSDWLEAILGRIEKREDCSDHGMLIVLALLCAGEELLPGPLRERMVRAVKGYRYWMDEPGRDSMCHWSESHQAVFAVCEHLAGERYPDEVFTNDQRRGSEKAARGRARLIEWLGNRFRHGFSEWLSPCYHAIEVSALTLLVERCADEELRTRAAMVIDLLLLDLAIHRFDGHFVASAGRIEAADKAHPGQCEVQAVVDSAFSRTQPGFIPSRPTSIFLARNRYRVPQVLREIAFAQADHLVTTAQGLTMHEVATEVARRQIDDPVERRDAAVNLLWGMGAIVTPEGIGPTVDAIGRWNMASNAFLAPLQPFMKVPSRRLLAGLVRSLNPITQGVALERANVQTYRTPHYLLSSAQHHGPGCFGDQENIWQASLPGGIQVFSTHPGSTLDADSARPLTPSGWVGNGIRPDVAQLRNVLLALYDLRGRRGYLEGRRHELSHLYFPAAMFDETKLGEKVVAGRRADSYFGAVALNRIEMPNEFELVQRGAVTGWAVMLADRSDFGSLHRFVDYLKDCRLEHVRDTLSWKTPEHGFNLTWNGAFVVDGAIVDTDYARLRSDWTSIGRKPSVIEITGRTGSLVLDWKLGERTQAAGSPRA